MQIKSLLLKIPEYSLVTLSLVLLTACTRTVEPTPQATQTPLPPPFDVTYCDIDPAEICMEGFGLDVEERLLVLFKVFDRAYDDIYVRSEGPDGDILFNCQQAESFSENVYCLGEPYPEGELIKLNIYATPSNKLLAIGVFHVQFADLPEPDFVFEPGVTPTPSLQLIVTATPTQGPSYPNPSYPNPNAP